MFKRSLILMSALVLVCASANARNLLFIDQPLKPVNTLGIMLGAITFNSSETISFDGVQFYNECTDELMTLYGDIKVNVHGVINGTQTKITQHINTQGIKAIGESGRTYQIAGTNNISETYTADSYTFRLVNKERWTTSGKGNNFVIIAVYSYTFDFDGNLTIKRDVFETYCQ